MRIVFEVLVESLDQEQIGSCDSDSREYIVTALAALCLDLSCVLRKCLHCQHVFTVEEV